MTTIDILDEFLSDIADLVLEILKKRGARRKALVDILLKKVHSKIMEKEILVQKTSLAMLVLEHRLARNSHAVENIALLKTDMEKLRTEKLQWMKLRELYAKRLDLLDKKLEETRAIKKKDIHGGPETS